MTWPLSHAIHKLQTLMYDYSQHICSTAISMSMGWYKLATSREAQKLRTEGNSGSI